MNIELDRKGLEILVSGSQSYYNEFENALVKRSWNCFDEFR